MTLWIIEPQEPLIVRDGRPFGATPGARARSLDFPFPSTIAGGVRTRAGQKNGRFDTNLIAAVKEIVVRGPLLAELDENDKLTFLIPAPGDALLIEDDEKEVVVRHRLRPLISKNALSNIPHGLHPVGLVKPDPRKPYKKAPRFWTWDEFANWLIQPPDAEEVVTPADWGRNGPGKEWRVHVKMDPTTFTGEEGGLFATSGLEFWERPSGERIQLADVKRLVLAVDVREIKPLTIDAGVAPLGGERRLMSWRQSTDALPTIPQGLVKAIENNDGHCRLILLTPAYFDAGWRPDFGDGAELSATAVSNPVVVSGWDFEKRSPKPTRRLAPAGSVYFVKITSDVKQWVEKRWLHPLGDDDELNRAGFGLTAVGVWDGTTPEITIKEEEEDAYT